MFQSLQQLQVNLGMQRANELLNNIYNLVKQQNSHFLVERHLGIEENLQYIHPKDYSLCKAALHDNCGVTPQPILVDTTTPRHEGRRLPDSL